MTRALRRVAPRQLTHRLLHLHHLYHRRHHRHHHRRHHHRHLRRRPCGTASRLWCAPNTSARFRRSAAKDCRWRRPPRACRERATLRRRPRPRRLRRRRVRTEYFFLTILRNENCTKICLQSVLVLNFSLNFKQIYTTCFNFFGYSPFWGRQIASAGRPRACTAADIFTGIINRSRTPVQSLFSRRCHCRLQPSLFSRRLITAASIGPAAPMVVAILGACHCSKPGGSTAASASNLALNSSTAASAAANRSRIVRCSLNAAAKRASASLRCALEEKQRRGGRGQGHSHVLCGGQMECKREERVNNQELQRTCHIFFSKNTPILDHKYRLIIFVDKIRGYWPPLAFRIHDLSVPPRIHQLYR
jgi:hypothetical protein